MQLPSAAAKVIGLVARGGQAAFNAFATWQTRVRVRGTVEDKAFFVTDHGTQYRVLAVYLTASEKADLIPTKAELLVHGSKAPPFNLKDRVMLPDVVAANRTETFSVTAGTLDELLAGVGEKRNNVMVEVRITDHYDRRHRTGWISIDREYLRAERSF